MQIEELISRLKGVKKTGPGRWIAQCPAHEDRSPSLSLKEADGGVVLLHDFGGCSPDDVCAAVGLELRDLFPPSERSPRDYQNGPPLRVGSVRFTALDALRCCAGEAGVALMLACDQSEGKVLAPEERDRLTLAVSRMDAALTYLGDQDDLEKITTL